MEFMPARISDFEAIRDFYWDVIDDIHLHNINNENLGWEKGVYPSDDYIRGSLAAGELYTLTASGGLLACVILNSSQNDGYDGCQWSIDCAPGEVITPHVLAVDPKLQSKGIGGIVVENIVKLAKAEHKQAIRLDVLGACRAAEKLYTRCGFRFVGAKNMFYEDTGWTEFKLFELNL